MNNQTIVFCTYCISPNKRRPALNRTKLVSEDYPSLSHPYPVCDVCRVKIDYIKRFWNEIIEEKK